MCYTNEGHWAAARSYRGSSWRPSARCVRWKQVHADNGKQPLGPIEDPAGTQAEERMSLLLGGTTARSTGQMTNNTKKRIIRLWTTWYHTGEQGGVMRNPKPCKGSDSRYTEIRTRYLSQLVHIHYFSQDHSISADRMAQENCKGSQTR